MIKGSFPLQGAQHWRQSRNYVDCGKRYNKVNQGSQKHGGRMVDSWGVNKEGSLEEVMFESERIPGKTRFSFSPCALPPYPSHPWCLCVCYQIFIHSSADGHWGCLHNLTVIDSAVLNIMGAVSFRISVFVFSGYIYPRVKLQEKLNYV